MTAPRLPEQPALFARSIRGLRSVCARFAEWNAQRRTCAALHVLSDRELADIGLSRGQIDQLFRRDAAPARATPVATAAIGADAANTNLRVAMPPPLRAA